MSMSAHLPRIRNAVLALVLAVHPAASDDAVAQQLVPPDVNSSISVLRLERGQRVSTAPDRGTTFHGLESQALRVTAVFEDAVATTERLPGGRLETRVTDRVGTPLATLAVTRSVGARDQIEFRAEGRRPVRAVGRSDLVPTLDWAARQAYALLRDGVAGSAARLEWRQNLLRPGRATRDVDAAIIEVRSEWPNGITAAAHWRAPQRDFLPSPVVTDSFTTFLRKDGVDLGWVRYYSTEQVLAWSFGSQGEQHLDAQRLAAIGGWPFVPDMAWANVQAFAFYQLPALRAEQAARVAAPGGWIARAVDFFLPTVHANEAGCDGLHWLDRTVFRRCCDQHDACYVRYGCTSQSWWWPFGSAWQCTSCNAGAFFCFNTAGGDGPYYPYP
jgi:hypothetical protein